MRTQGLCAQVGYGRKPRFHAGTPCKSAANLLDWQFEVTEPDTAWASDFTFIRTHEGWMYLAVVIDLFSQASRRLGDARSGRYRVGRAGRVVGGLAAQTRIRLSGLLGPRIGLHEQ
ncbi:hypothetical isxac3 transposase orfb (fragment) protein [Xanthomonas albilineans GPE PC73]|uniref:Hypothetical isxac3 transposase orfb protein n=1 Tax=Xanthomonas albilineans (strain GPE PC73 / CFBP 7063) TaxID=380358 RepID=D2UGA2_XANAP